MSWYIHHCGEQGNRCFAEVYETDLKIVKSEASGYFGPYDTEEAAIAAAERKGLTLTSLKEANK